MKSLKMTVLLFFLSSGCGVTSEKALVQAASMGDTETLERLYGKGGADVNALVEGETPLTTALGNGHPEVVPLLLKFKPDLKVPNGKLHTPLQVAAFNGYLMAATQLLDAGADPDEKGSASPPLLLAILGDQPDIVRLLLARHVDLKVSWGGKTPMMAAAESNKADIIPILLAAGSP